MRSPLSSAVAVGALAAFACAPLTVHAQQYAGEVINNTLPSAPGSEITYFKILDSKGAGTTLINYYSLPNGKRPSSSARSSSSTDFNVTRRLTGFRHPSDSPLRRRTTRL
jgi:hypothetical protein